MIEQTTPVEVATPAAPVRDQPKKGGKRSPEAIARRQATRKLRQQQKEARSNWLRDLDWIIKHINDVPTLDQIPRPIRSGDATEDAKAEQEYKLALVNRDATLSVLSAQRSREVFNRFVEAKRSLAAQKDFIKFYDSENSKAEAAAKKLAEPSAEWGDDRRRQFRLFDVLAAEAPELIEQAKEYHARNRKRIQSAGVSVPRVAAVGTVGTPAGARVAPVEAVEAVEVSH